ncbi:MAG TPA: hypothetical protein VNJ28_08715, partial [Candidatus Limnocylindrales bacterium]|nr:hypothetical protein [Candidatus Limnocylindrales bacterium]
IFPPIPTARAHPPARALALALAAGLAIASVAGCGGDVGGSPVPSRSGGPAEPPPLSLEPTGGPSAGVSATPTVSPAPSELLQAALDRLASVGYRVEATVSVGGLVATRATGRGAGSAVELSIGAGGTTLTYRQIGTRFWVREGEGAWRELEAPSTAIDPLASLRHPLDVQFADGAAADRALEFTVQYAGADLGLEVDVVSVDVRLAGDGTLRVRYATTVGGRAATSETTFEPEPNQSPILPPG